MEGFLNVDHKPFGFVESLHYFVYFLDMFLVGSLLLAKFAREPIVSASKKVLLAFPLILLGPILDFLLSNGTFQYRYIQTFDPLQLLHLYSTLASSSQFIPSGLRFEVLALSGLLGYYALLQTGSWSRGILGSFALYTAVFLSATLLPVIAALLLAAALSYLASPLLLAFFPPQKIQIGFLEFLKTSPDSQLLAAFSLWLAALLLLWLAVYEKRKIHAVSAALRIERGLGYLVFAAFGFLLAGGSAVLPLLFALLAVLFVWWGAVLINDVTDIKIDRISNPDRPFVKKLLTKEESAAGAAICFFLAMLFAGINGLFPALLIAGGTIVSIFYSLPPFRLRNFPIISTLVLGSSALIAFAVGFYSAGAAVDFPTKIGLVVLLGVTIGFNAKDLKDDGADQRAGVKTLISFFPNSNRRLWTAGLLLLTFFLAPFLLDLTWLWPFSLALGLVAAWSVLSVDRFQLALLGTYVVLLFFLGHNLLNQSTQITNAGYVAIAVSGAALLEFRQRIGRTKLIVAFALLILVFSQLPTSSVDPPALDARIQQGLAFLENHQAPSGEFPSYHSESLTMEAPNYGPAPYVSFTIFLELEGVPAQKVRQRITSYAQRLQLESGLFSVDGGNPHRIPPDADDSVTGLLVLKKSGLVQNASIESLLKPFSNGQGLFYSWPDNGDVDCVINSNVLYAFSSFGGNTAPLCDYLNGLVRTNKTESCSNYATSKYAVFYFITRAYAAGATCLKPSLPAIQNTLLAGQTNGSWGGDLENAMATLSLIHTGYRGPALDKAIQKIAAAQMRDGGWSMGVIYVNPPNEYVGSRDITTVLSLKALQLYKDLKTKSQT